MLGKYWIRSTQRGAPENVALAIVGNKCDVEDERQVSTEEAEEFAKTHDAVFMEVSAKSGANIHSLFEKIGEFAHELGLGQDRVIINNLASAAQCTIAIMESFFFLELFKKVLYHFIDIITASKISNSNLTTPLVDKGCLYLR